MLGENRSANCWLWPWRKSATLKRHGRVTVKVWLLEAATHVGRWSWMLHKWAAIVISVHVWSRLRRLVLIDTCLSGSRICSRRSHIGQEAVIIWTGLLITGSVGHLNGRVNLRCSKIGKATAIHRTHEIVPLYVGLTRRESNRVCSVSFDLSLARLGIVCGRRRVSLRSKLLARPRRLITRIRPSWTI